MASPKTRIATRLVIAFVLPTTLVILVSAWLTLRSARNTFAEQFARQVDRLAATLASQIDVDQVLSLLPGDEQQLWYTKLADSLKGQAQAADVQSLVLFDRSGRVFVDANRHYPIDAKLADFAKDRDIIQRALDRQNNAWVSGRGADGASVRAFKRLEVTPIAGSGEDEVLLLAIETHLRDRALMRGYVTRMIPLSLLSLLAVVLIAILVSRGITKPVRVLVSEAQRLGAGDFKKSIALAPRRDEIGFLTATLEEMRAALQARDRDRQVMLASIAHEVRNPLAGIELFLGLLREGLQELDQALTATAEKDANAPELSDDSHNSLVELQGYSQRIQRELGYLTGVVNDFLSFAREMPLQSQELSASDLFNEVEALLHAEAEAVGVTLVVDINPEIIFQGDRGALHRALLNLGQNALQASRDQGQVRFHAQLDRDFVVLSVEDQGCGIPDDKLQDILTPFFTTKEKGTGLGLALVDKIARAHGGQLKVQSQVGRGTTMQIRVLQRQIDRLTQASTADDDMG